MRQILLETDSLLQEFLDLSLQKRDALVENDVQKVIDIVSLEDGLLRKFRVLSQQKVPNISKESPMFLKVAKKAALLKEANRFNQALIRQGLSLVRWELELLTPKMGYDGKPLGAPQVLDTRV